MQLDQPCECARGWFRDGSLPFDISVAFEPFFHIHPCYHAQLECCPHCAGSLRVSQAACSLVSQIILHHAALLASAVARLSSSATLVSPPMRAFTGWEPPFFA